MAQDYGLLDNILSGILRPFNNIVEDTANGANLLANSNQQNVQKIIGDQDNYEQLKANPLGKITQDAASVGSYALPVGGGIGGAIAGGLGAGALQGYANQDLRNGFNAGDIASGAAMGGLTGGVLHGVGSLLGRGANSALENTTSNGVTEGELPQNLSLLGKNTGNTIDNVTNNGAVEGGLQRKLLLGDSQSLPQNSPQFQDAEFRDIRDQLNNNSNQNSPTPKPQIENPKENLDPSAQSPVQQPTNRFSQGLFNTADGLESNSFKRQLGGYPGTDLVQSAKDMGLDLSSNQNLLKSSQSFLDENSSKIGDQLQGLGQKAGPIDMAPALDNLKQAAQNAPTNEESQAIKKVIDGINSNLERNALDPNNPTVLDPADVYKLKQSYGKIAYGASKAADPSITSQVPYLRQFYNDSNGALDGYLKDNGFNDFRTLNSNISDATNLRDFAEKASQKASTRGPVNLSDIMAFAGGGFAGLPGSMAFTGANKILQSPQAERFLASGARALGKGIEGISNGGIGSKIGDVLGGAGNLVNNINPELRNSLANGVNDLSSGNILPSLISNTLTQKNMNPNQQSQQNQQPKPQDLLTQLNSGGNAQQSGSGMQQNNLNAPSGSSGSSGSTGQQSNMPLFQQFLKAGVPLDQVIKYTQYFGGGGNGMMSSNPEYRANQQASELVNNASSGVDQLNNRFGPGNGVLSQINASLGNDNQRVALQGQFDRLKSALPTVFGGKITPEVEKQYEQDYVPSFNDNSSVAKQKLATLSNLINENQRYTPYYGTGK